MICSSKYNVTDKSRLRVKYRIESNSNYEGRRTAERLKANFKAAHNPSYGGFDTQILLSKKYNIVSVSIVHMGVNVE